VGRGSPTREGRRGKDNEKVFSLAVRKGSRWGIFLSHREGEGRVKTATREGKLIQ